MSSRLARNVASSAARRASTRASTSARMATRNMSTVQDTVHAAKTSSDKPWIIGSALLFGPAFLYLVSPTARKNRHDLHDDKHDFPGYVPKDEAAHAAPAAAPKPDIMKDDEGTPANVAESVKLSEQSDVPNASQSAEAHSETRAAAENTDATEKTTEETPKTNAKASEIKSEEHIDKGKAGTFKDGEEGATNMDAPRVASQQGITPKEKTEGKHESKEELAKSKKE